MKTTMLKFWKRALKREGFGLYVTAVSALILTAGNVSATVVTTLGGGPSQSNSKFYGFTDGSTTLDSQFNFPCGMAVDPSGTLLFLADFTNNAVRMVTLPGNSSSTTSTFARTNHGISRPVSVLVDSHTNVYVLNQGNGKNGNIMEYSGLYATFNVPPIFIATNAWSLTNATAMDIDGLTNIFVTVRSNMVIKVAPSGVVSLVGLITNTITSLRGIVILDNGQLALTDAGNHGIWIMDPMNSNRSNNAVKLTGFHGPGYTNGPPIFSAFNRPEMISKASNNVLVVADRGNNRVRLVDAVSGTVSRLYGVRSNLWIQGSPQNGIFPGWWDGTVNANENLSGSVEAREPFGVFVAQDGSVFTTEVYYHLLRQTTVTGLGGPGAPVLPSLFSSPRGIALDASGTSLYIADQTNNTIDILDLTGNTTTTFLTVADGINHPSDVKVDPFDTIFVLNQGTGGNGSILTYDLYGNFLGTNVSGLSSPTAMTMDFSGNIFVAELNGTIQKFNGGTSNTIVTITTNVNVRLQGIALFDDGTIIVSDSGNHVLWQVNPVTKVVTLLTGSIGTPGSTLGSPASAKLNAPHHLVEAAGNQIIISDSGNNRLAVVSRTGSVTNVLKSTNSIVWFGRPGDPFSPSNSKWVSMVSPWGITLGSDGSVFASETVNNDIRKVLSTGFTQPPPPVPAPAPAIGWVDFTLPPLVVSVLRTGTSFVFNNDVNIQILGPGDSQIFYTFGPTPLASLIPDPNATNGTTAPLYQDGVPASSVPATIVTPQPDFIVKAVGANPGAPNSTVVQARFQFVCGTPQIIGNNAALFSVTNVTSGSTMYYTTNGTVPDPTANATASIGPVGPGAQLSLDGSADITFRIRTFKANYQPSGIATTTFASSNFIPNKITFGVTNANAELHSSFIAGAGQIFYAPITLQLQPGGETMFSLQFNVTVTNGPATTSLVDSTRKIGFFSMLMSKVTPLNGDHFPPNDGQWYLTIPPFLMNAPTNNVGTSTFVNTNNNLLGVGFLFREGYRYLVIDSITLKTLLDFDTVAQDLITYSIAHDTLFKKVNGTVVVGAYSFLVPDTAVIGDKYSIQLGSPSGTRDGIGAPGANIFIRSPGTSQAVTVGNPTYIAGDVAPFRWLNAGDFGEGVLDNADVMQVFQSAILGDDMPPTNSDLFYAMDSAGNFGAAGGDGIYLPTSFNTDLMVDDPAAAASLFDGSDVDTINAMPFGDGKLDIDDVFVTFRRSLDPSLLWFQRFYTNGLLVAVETPNLAFNSNNPTMLSLKMNKTLNSGGSGVNPSITFYAGDAVGSAGQTVQIPVKANVFGDYPVSVLGLNITVRPLDGSPALTQPVQFSTGGLGQPTLQASKNPANFAGAWLDNGVAGLSGDSVIGTLSVTIPATATGTAAYAISFDHASGSPNGVAALPKTTTAGLITLSTRTNSTYHDGIPDSWRLRYFGTVNNLLSMANADADGDGMNNLHEYIAGTDPLNAKSNLRMGIKPPATGNQPAGAGTSDCAIHWPSVSGKYYVIERAASLYSPVWTTVSTNIGTGTDMEIHDANGGDTRYYRVRVLP